MRIVFAACLSGLLLTLTATCGRTEEPKPRPVYHFTPERNFINDPNGLVYLAGEYHLFYQHNPEGDRWGHMSWGHAVSLDLIRWRHLPIALREENGIMIFSGSAVVDDRNTSGLGEPGSPPMVAVYTGDGHGKQTQNLASSVDRGRTWKKFPGNPVIDVGSNSFRDPKVFWHLPTKRWIMATVMADDRKVRFWGSPDLKQWTQLSGFGPRGSVQGVWECPELVELPIEDSERGETRWMLKVDVNDGAPAGGSGGQYFLGKFDGTRFIADDDDRPNASALWVDHGKDFYAAQAWNDAPGSGGPVWIAWMNNWQYANEIPTAPWRGAMTIPRRIALRSTADGLRLVQRPAASLNAIRRNHRAVAAREIPIGATSLKGDSIQGRSIEILAKIDAGQAGAVGLEVLQGDGEKTVIGVDRANGVAFIDRTHSGKTDFSPHFPGRHTAPLPLESLDKPFTLQILIDATSVEVFVNDGIASLTDQVFAGADSQGVSLFATIAPARLLSLEAWDLQP